MKKSAARLDLLKQVLGRRNLNFSAADFPTLSSALGRAESDVLTSADILKALNESGVASSAAKRKSRMASELSDVLAATRADNKAIQAVKNDMGSILNEGNFDFKKIGPALYSHAGKMPNQLITERQLRRALQDAQKRLETQSKVNIGDIAIGSTLGAGAGIAGATYLNNKKSASDYSAGFLAKCEQLGEDPDEVVKQAQDPALLSTMLNAATGAYKDIDIPKALETANQTVSDYPRSINNMNVMTSINDPVAQKKQLDAETIKNLISTIKNLVIG